MAASTLQHASQGGRSQAVVEPCRSDPNREADIDCKKKETHPEASGKEETLEVAGSPQSTPSSPRPGSVKDECVDKYKDHFSFLRDSKFLEDLENDSVDSDIIEEELTALQETSISPREKVVKFLQSNPVQIVLCVMVLLDAGIVIAQIILDLNSVKGRPSLLPASMASDDKGCMQCKV